MFWDAFDFIILATYLTANATFKLASLRCAALKKDNSVFGMKSDFSLTKHMGSDSNNFDFDLEFTEIFKFVFIPCTR
jgi:hypothetical protein